MRKCTTASRLKLYMDLTGDRQIDILRKVEPYATRIGVRIGKPDISMYLSGKMEPKKDKIHVIAYGLNVSEAWLMGYDVPMERPAPAPMLDLPSPTIATSTVTFPVLGEIAAGYDKIAIEDWTGETIEIPESALLGHDRDDFFVLRVSGDSMYPHYQDGDYVLVLKQPALDHSGEVAAIIYDDECVSLKKIEYVEGEDWLRLVPINPNHPPKRIEGEALAHCRIIGIPRLLFRKL